RAKGPITPVPQPLSTARFVNPRRTGAPRPGPAMRLPLRPAIAVFVTMAAAVGLVTCMDSPTAPKRGAVAGLAHLSLVPVFSAEAQAAYANLADFDISFNNVRIVIVRPVADTVVDVTIAFKPGQEETTI